MTKINRLEIKKLCVEVEGKKLLEDVNLIIPKGEVHALMGMNGSGKSTLMMTIMGFPKYKISSGKILLNGVDVTDMPIDERARLGIGIAQQRPPILPGVTLATILSYLDDGQPTKALEKQITYMKMDKYTERDLYKGFSGGEIKRAEILQLFAQSPCFAMLDEPDSGVDLESLQLMSVLMGQLFEKDEACDEACSGLIVTHYGDVLENVHVNKAHVMMNGKICCSGNPETIVDVIKSRGYEACILCMEKGQ